MQSKTYCTTIAGRTFEVVVGKFAPLTDASVLVSYEDTQVLVHVTSSSARDDIDFFPLSCEFREKLYAVGRIPGGYNKREGRPTDQSVLNSRLIDRPIRPLFPKGYKNDVQIIAQVMSVDHSCAPEIVSIIGASVALSLAPKIPFKGPIGALQIGYINDELVFNPSEEQLENSKLSLALAGTKDAVMMVEAQVDVLGEDIILDAILKGHEEIKNIVSFIEEIVEDQNVVKEEYVPKEIDEDFKNRIEELAKDKVLYAFEEVTDKEERGNILDSLKEEITEKLSEEYEDFDERKREFASVFKDIEKSTMRSLILEKDKRPDGRDTRTIRNISTEIGLMKRTHGSGYFTRGLTSALSLTTLGALGEAQRLDGIEVEESKRFMHHYNFPAFSVGETGPMRGPNRRAIGHGALGEKALLAVIPDEDDFPYTIRVVSEVLSSNGSTSQASICAATMSMLNAGVPLKDSVAGIAMGLIKEDDNVKILSDIQGIEDFLGDMDFKVAGTKDGITAIQMDIKIAGIGEEILKEALEQARIGRMHILGKMAETITTPQEMSKWAPRVFMMKVDPDKIRDIIGTGGKTITKITTENDVKIDIDDDGRVIITAANSEGGIKAKEEIENIVKEIEVGEVFDAKIVRIASFGAFVELSPGHEALCHVSELTVERLDKVESKFKEGDIIKVKVIKKDTDGKLSVSAKALLEADAKKDIMQKVANIKVGDVFTSKILRITKFGAFVSLVDGLDGLCHISELTLNRLKRVEDEFKIGDEIVVKVISIEDDKVGVSRKALISDGE